MDAASAGATTGVATMAVATMAVGEMATDLDTVIEAGAALQVAAAIAAGSVEMDFAAMAADSTAAVIAVEDPTVVAIGNMS